MLLLSIYIEIAVLWWTVLNLPHIIQLANKQPPVLICFCVCVCVCVCVFTRCHRTHLASGGGKRLNHHITRRPAITRSVECHHGNRDFSLTSFPRVLVLHTAPLCTGSTRLNGFFKVTNQVSPGVAEPKPNRTKEAAVISCDVMWQSTIHYSEHLSWLVAGLLISPLFIDTGLCNGNSTQWGM